MRQITLDTETTGLDPNSGHRVVEIACVEIIDRKISGENFHSYFNPEREIDAGAFKVNKLTRDFLQDKPLFAAVCDELVEFVRGGELIIHNAAFDIAFLDAEFSRAGRGGFIEESGCKLLDTLELARDLHPGLQNTLEALCVRYSVAYSARDAHSASADSEWLAHVYLAMTGGQINLGLDASANVDVAEDTVLSIESGLSTPVISASLKEVAAHERFIKEVLQKAAHRAAE